MAYRRTYRRRRPTNRRPRRAVYRRRLRSSRRPRLSALRTHHFKRTFTLSPIATATTTVFGAYAFSLSDLPNYSEFTALYDQYRINKLVVRFVPNHNSSEVGATKALMEFNSVLDFNDQTAPTALTQLYEYANWRMTRGNSIHTRVFSPAVLGVVSTINATNFTGDQSKWKQWLATSQTDIEHYGIKYAIGATAAAGDMYFTPYITAYFSCKSIK